NDLVKYRSYWHKIWEGGFSKSKRWNLDFDLKYFYALDLEEAAITRLESVQKIEEDNAKGPKEPDRRRIVAKLKSGLDLSLSALNQLLPLLAQPALNSKVLEALQTPKLLPYYNQVARTKLAFKGRSGDTGTLWAYPEVRLQKIILQKPRSVNAHGQVTAFESQTVLFPRPVHIHFIGTKSS
ncbi:MAG: hypothetical protein AAFP19_14450, partial [Bacteroidota bacterium]